jgi:glycerophosphoryl diester phosphodiesterase
MYADLPRPTIFGHRGASAHAPENTLAAFDLALRQGAPAIELDAKLSADEHVVVIHDSTVDRTTDGSGKVAELPLNILKELDAGCSFDQTFCGQRIPTLAETFEAVGQDLFINVELTNYASLTDSLPEKVAELVARHGMESRVLFSSFNPLALRRIQKLLPGIPVGLLTLEGSGGFWTRAIFGSWIPYQALHPALSETTATLIQTQHKHGRRVHVYTVNDPEDMRQLFAWKVDGIFTDDPLLALEILNTTQSL